MLDLIIEGGRVVTPHGVGTWDIGVEGETVAAVAASGAFGPDGAARIIDARGLLVVPGGVDPHIHCSWPIPDPAGGPAVASGPPSQVSRAALFGGTTTLIDFAVWSAGQSVQAAIEARDREWRGQCYCDYAYHVMLQGEILPAVLGELGEAIDAGYATVKIFTTDITPSRRGRMIDFGDIWEILQVTARHGGLAAIHAEDNDIVMHMYDKLIAAGRVGFEHLSEVHNALSEDLSFRRIIRLAETIEGAALYMMHTSAASGVEAIAESRAKGYPVYGETLHQYLLHTSDDYRLPNGQIYHTYPSLKTERDQAALWDGMRGGTLQTVATDEICCTLARKTQGIRIDDTTGGNVGVEPRLGLMYTEMVDKRGYSLEEFVALTSTNAAKIMGLYPRKGVIAPGSDADLTLLDPGIARAIRGTDLHATDYTPWEGHEVTAWPAMTILRGKVVVEGGEFRGALTDGRYLERRIAQEIVAGGRA